MTCYHVKASTGKMRASAREVKDFATVTDVVPGRVATWAKSSNVKAMTNHDGRFEQWVELSEIGCSCKYVCLFIILQIVVKYLRHNLS